MFGDTALLQQTLMQGGMDRLASPEQARRQAAQLYWQTYLRARVRRVWQGLTGRRAHLAGLDEVVGETAVATRRHLGVHSVPLSQIAGSEGRSRDFDASFRPLTTHARDRWIGIAVARRLGIPLPPVELVQVGSRYVVRDGNHRISVARSLGQVEIDAVVTRWA